MVAAVQGMAPAEVEQLLAMYEQMGLVGEDGELMPEGLPLDFLEQMLGGEQSDTVGGLTLEAIPDTDDEVSVVINHEEQYSIWPHDRRVPKGYEPVPMPEGRETCRIDECGRLLERLQEGRGDR